MTRLHRSRAALPHADGGYVEAPTDADYAAAARWALERGDLALAVEQVAAAISDRPLFAPYLRLLDAIVARTKGPLRLVELPPTGGFFGLCAVRARVLARLGRVDEAIRDLFEATAFSPTTPFMPWTREWVRRAKQARTVNPDTLAAGLVSLTEALRASRTVDDGAVTNLRAALHVAERVRAERAAATSLLVAEARALRLLGAHGEALARLGDGVEWELAVERAAIHRERGEHGAQVRALEQAAAARPEEPATDLDLGAAYLDAGRPAAALLAYERALRGADTSAPARIAAAYARAIAGGSSAEELGEPVGRLSEMGGQGRSFAADLSAYSQRLGDPIDPLVGIIRSAEARAREIDPDQQLVVRVRAARALSPSASLAFSQVLTRCARRGVLRVEHAAGVQPSLGPLWISAAPEALPAVPRPADSVLAVAAELAQAPFEWSAWRAMARELSARHAFGAEMIDAMAYPPQAPAEADAVQWVHGFQVAAAMLVAAGPEAVAEREARLCALLGALDDWTSTAALLGLRALGNATPRLIDSLAALLPSPMEPLPSLARALAITGAELASGDARQPFLCLRARVRRQLEGA